MELEIKDYSLPSIRRRASARDDPDVPEDITVALLHFNDPNWTFDDESDTASFDAPSYTTEDDRLKYSSSFDMARSSKLSRAASSFEYDSEMNSPSTLRFSSAEAVDYEDESPYAEVRAAVSNADDPNMPVNTFRMWTIGIFTTLIISGVNQIFAMRYPSVYISVLVAQLATLPLGKLFERVLPTTQFNTFGFKWTLNPGPFNVKEHTLITVMANVVTGGAYATDVIATQRIHFNQNWGLGYQLLLCFSSQLIGFAFAGAFRKFLVWPSAMIYPGVLVNCALFNTLHSSYGKSEGPHMSRERFFLYAFVCSFVWYFFPGYIFTALSIFNWVCWIAPNNAVVNQLFGYQSGLGMGFLTFDWAMISYIGSPLVCPWWAQLNIFTAFTIFMWILAPILYYKNVFYSKYLPISATSTFDNTGSNYNATSVIINGQFDLEAYQSYSPIFLPITLVLNYAISFATFTSILVHTWLWYRRDLATQVRKSLRDNRDVHSRLMAHYPEAPLWWFLTLGLAAFGLAVGAVRAWDTKLPVWALLIALLIAIIFIIPAGIVRAITNQTVPVQILGELVVGYVLPGRPVAMMIFKTFSFISMSQALNFTADLKLGHYMKIPPRLMFLAQVIATIECVVVVVLVQQWMFANIPDMCSKHQEHMFTCPSTNTFASAAVIWGGIGPERLFSMGKLYYPITLFFVGGLLAPIPFYYLAKRYPTSIWRYVNIPVMLSGVSVMPPASGINFSSWIALGAFFQYFMRRFHFKWWKRYNYILSAALDSGVAVSLIIIFFALQLPKGGINLNWWGNTVWQNTADYDGVPGILLAEGETFGPST